MRHKNHQPTNLFSKNQSFQPIMNQKGWKASNTYVSQQGIRKQIKPRGAR